MLTVCWCSLTVVCLFGGFWVTVVGVAIQFCWVWDFGGLSGFGCFGCLGCLGCQLGFGLVVFWCFCCEFVGDYCLVLYLV